MRRLIRPLLDRPGLSAAALATLLLLGIPADLAAPLLPVLPILAGLAVLGLGAGFIAARRKPEAAWPHGVLTFMAILAIGWGLGSLGQLAAGPRGLVVAAFPDFGALQNAVMGHPPGSPEATESLRAALAGPDAPLRPRPVTADEFLYNAILLRERDEPVQSARALAEALRRGSPRPDAVLLHGDLLATGLPGVREHLEPLPEGLDEATRGYLEAMRLADPRARVAALTPLVEADAEALLPAAALAEALVAASLPQGPTIAMARRIAGLIDLFGAEDVMAPFAERFLRPAQAERLANQMAALEWTREVATRRLSVSALAPPPGTANAPILLRVTPPEPATGIQFARPLDGDAMVWAEVPQRTSGPERDSVPTLRLPRPWRPQELLFRHIDRDGVPSEPARYAFDPATAIREAAQRQLQRQSIFALYQPGYVGAGRLNTLGIPGNLRAGLIAIEWHTELNRTPRNQPVGVPDEVILAGEVGRLVVELPVQAGSRTLFLVMVYADGSRSPVLERPIR
jgi:hypothetical protein